MADLLDVARLQVDLNRKAVLQFEEAGSIEHRRGVIFRERLLGGGEQPHRAIADLFQVFGQSVEIENQIGFGRGILTDLVDDKENILLAGLPAHQLDHLLGTFDFALGNVEGEILEVLSLGKEFGVKLRRQTSGDLIGHQRLVVDLGPLDALQLFLGAFEKGIPVVRPSLASAPTPRL